MPEAANDRLIVRLNDALGWEMRAMTLYAHYAAYVKGIYRLQLKPFFEAEATESMTHSTIVRAAIVKLGGQARTERDATEIVHTTDYRVMLDEALKTETHAAKSYREILDMGGLDSELYDAIEQIHFAEERSVEELHQMGID
jgi:bacterioferritin (cytochrome b1)